MNYPLSEIVDRLSILYLKQEGLNYSEDINTEVDRFRDAAFAFSVPTTTLHGWINSQKEINRQIWDLEVEVGKYALKIRELNQERIRRKNEIAKAMGEYQEIKVGRDLG